MYGHLVDFQYFANTNCFAINNFMICIFILLEEYLQGRYLEMGLLSQNRSVYVVLLNITKFLSRRDIIIFFSMSNV